MHWKTTWEIVSKPTYYTFDDWYFGDYIMTTSFVRVDTKILLYDRCLHLMCASTRSVTRIQLSARTKSINEKWLATSDRSFDAMYKTYPT